MRAEGALTDFTKAPSQASEPSRRSSRGDPPVPAGAPVRAARLGHASATSRRSARSTSGRPGEVVGIVGPSGCGKSTLLELVGGPPRADAGTIAVGGDERGRERLSRCAYMPQRDLLLPWLTALDNAALAPAQPRRVPARGARRRAGRSSRALASAGSSAPGPASSPAGCASGSPSCARCSRGSRCCCSTSRSPRSMRSPAPRCRSGCRRRWRPSRATVAPRHARRRGGALSLRPRRWCCRPRPGRVLGTLRSPAPRAPDGAETVTSPEFADLRERALEPRGGTR